MKFWKTLIIGGTIAGLCVGAGCKKAEKAAEDAGIVANEAAQQLDAIAQSIKTWDKSEVNALLQFVPADTPMILASTRRFDINAPGMDRMIEMASKGTESLMNKAKEERLVSAGVIYVLDEVTKATKNYKSEAANWGLDAEHNDTVAYIDTSRLVMKSTVHDSKKFKARVDALIEQANAKAGEGKKVFEAKEIKGGDEPWVLYTILDKDLGAGSYAVHFGKSVLTAVSADNTATAESLDRYTKTAEKPMSKDALKISNDEAIVGFVDNANALNALAKFNQSLPESQKLDMDFSETCLAEYRTLLESFPKLRLSMAYTDKAMKSSAVLEMTDKAAIDKIKALKVKNIDMSNEQKIGEVSVALNLPKTLEFLNEVAASQSQKKYQCETLQSLSELRGTMAQLTLASLGFKSAIESITGIQAVATKLDLKAKPMQIEAAVAVTGSNLKTVIPDLVKKHAPRFISFIPTDENVTNLDLTELLDAPIKVDIALNDTALAAATAPNDAKAIAGSSTVDAPAFISFMVTDTLINAIAGSEILSGGLNYEITIGAADTGIAFGLNMAY